MKINVKGKIQLLTCKHNLRRVKYIYKKQNSLFFNEMLYKDELLSTNFKRIVKIQNQNHDK